MYHLKLKTVGFFLLLSLSLVAQVKHKPISGRINTGPPKTRVLPSAISERQLKFKGYGLQVFDEAADENGNHLLIGTVNILEKDPAKRDKVINEAITGLDVNSKQYIFLATDSNYKLIKAHVAFSPTKVKYSPQLRKFIVATSEYTVSKRSNSYGSVWQPALVVIDIGLIGQAYYLETDYSCYLENFVVQDDLIHLFTKSDIGSNRNELLEIFTVSLDRSHIPFEKDWIRVFDPLNTVQTAYVDQGRLSLSDISVVDDTLYFATSNLDQSKLEIKNHLYQFKALKLEEQDFADAYLIHKDKSMFMIKSFIATSKNDYFFYAGQAAEKSIRLIRSDNRFRVLKSLDINNDEYSDWDKALQLTDGAIVTAYPGKDKLWHYTIYNSNLEFVKEVVSQVADKYYLQRFTLSTNSKVRALFIDISPTHSSKVLIQDVETKM